MKSNIISILTALLLCFGMGARADNVVTIGTASGAPGEEVTVSVGLANTDAVSSLQLSIPMNEELTFVDGSAVLGSRCTDHSVTAGVKDNMLNIIQCNPAVLHIFNRDEVFSGFCEILCPAS